jgi:hypothetical protein
MPLEPPRLGRAFGIVLGTALICAVGCGGTSRGSETSTDSGAAADATWDAADSATPPDSTLPQQDSGVADATDAPPDVSAADGTSDAASDVRLDVAEAGDATGDASPICAPGSVAAFTPTPVAASSNAPCAAAQIQGLVTACLDRSSTSTTCGAFTSAPANQACVGGCPLVSGYAGMNPITPGGIVPPPVGPWGPLVQIENPGSTQFYNLANCVTALDKSAVARSCATALEASLECNAVACAPFCSVPAAAGPPQTQAQMALTACFAAAEGCPAASGSCTGPCGPYENAANAACAMLSASSAASLCLDGSLTSASANTADAALVTWLAAACGGNDAGSDAGPEAGDAGDAGSDGGSSFPEPPHVIDAGGPVLTSPILVPIFFSNDTDPNVGVTQMVAFFENIGATSHWQALAEYGVGPPSAVVPVMLAQPAPATIIDDGTAAGAMQTLLAGLIAGATGGTPAPTPNTLYVLNFPTTTTVSSAPSFGGGTGCKDYGAYHFNMQYSGQDVAYAVVPRCPASFLGLPTDLDEFTGVASHELVEGVTDPYPGMRPAWTVIDTPHAYYAEANGGAAELADMCFRDPEAFHTFPDSPFTVQRFWSNMAALAGHDPCVPPLPAEVYFTSVPVLGGTGTFSYGGATSTVASASIPVGMSATIPIDLRSDGVTGSWTVSVLDFGCMETGQASAALLGLTLAAGVGTSCVPTSTTCSSQVCTGNDGSSVNLTIQAKTAGNPSTNYQPTKTELFEVLSQQGSGSTALRHVSWGVVTN